MGGYVIVTVLRAMEDVARLYLRRSGACSSVSGAGEEDALTAVEDVETQYLCKTPYIPSQDASLANQVVRIRYKEHELEDWIPLILPKTTHEAPRSHSVQTYTDFVTQIQFLLPTLLRIADTRNGWNLSVMLQLCRWGVLQRVCYLVDLIPSFVVRAVASFMFDSTTQNTIIASSCF
uniref:RNA polymerase sigma factor rpoD n=1 Tax=Lygus hesperus TaxID=30085 RepID=A0A0A9W2R9_LYGHE